MTVFIDIFFTNWHIILLFFIVAITYSSVGFGGGSSYLAILTLTSLWFTEVRAIALLCNLVVVLGNVIQYQKQHLYQWKKVFPLVLFSIPLAFLGGYIPISQTFFFILLAFTLLIAAIIMWFSNNNNLHKNNLNNLSFSKNTTYGGVIGFISGMVGIGGGIFLAPLLHLTNWNTPKKIAATASFFILANSVAGLVGQYLHPNFSINWHLTSVLLVTVLLGGQIGVRLGTTFFTQIQLKKATAILIAFVSIRIFIKHLF